jgi:hypothetical protein
MNESYRVSMRWRLIVRLRPVAVSLLLLALLVYLTSVSGELPTLKIAGYLAFTAAMTALAWFVTREDLRWAQTHALKCQADGLLILNGDEKTILPYERIASVDCIRLRGYVIRLRISSDSKAKSLTRYENVHRLAECILSSTPQAKTRVSNWFMPNKSLERTRDR